MKLHATDRVIPQPDTSAMAGEIRWQPAKSLWTFTHMILGIAGVVLYPHWNAALVFIVLCAITRESLPNQPISIAKRAQISKVKFERDLHFHIRFKTYLFSERGR